MDLKKITKVYKKSITKTLKNILPPPTIIPVYLYNWIYLFKNKKGFSIIGVMVASAIGLIVITGLTQLFTNLSSQLKQMEEKGQRVFLNDFIGSKLKSACKQTLEPFINNIREGKTVENIQDIKKPSGDTALHLKDNREELSAKYGLAESGDAHLKLDCSESSCDCSAETSSCQKEWTITLISRSIVKGLPVYNRTASFDTSIIFPNAVARPRDFTCSMTGSSMGEMDCIKTDKVAGLALVGCGTTTETTNKTITAYGYNAGNEKAGSFNTFIGHETGIKTTGKYNTFLGYHAGYNNTIGTSGREGKNTFVGANAGLSNIRGGLNTFIGYNAGLNNTAGIYNTFVGSYAGEKHTKGWGTFVGYQAGRYSEGYGTFLGAYAGYKNTSGHNNIFIGHYAGGFSTGGRSNIFIGDSAGSSNQTGNYNIFIGTQAGYRNKGRTSKYPGGKLYRSQHNIFMGFRAGHDNTIGYNNIFIGPEAGYRNTTGTGNILIGNGARASSKTENNYLSIRNWITGKIGTDILVVNGKQVCLEGGPVCSAPSSRTLKKNIKAFKNFKKALEDIIKTPLFTFKRKQDPSGKKQMGIISEELPDHLQVKEKDKVSMPDWSSITGTLWAGIKALYSDLKTLKESFLQFKKQTVAFIEEFTEQFLSFKKETQSELIKTKKELADTKEQLKKLEKKLEDLQTAKNKVYLKN